ncbi:MAG: tRNA pseudouridine(55) synthase TruB [Oscillospiraceae bacterium]|nr:tRNA pseudouridine(55) synthase TruB [Oscillospiraceae bacterium]
MDKAKSFQAVEPEPLGGFLNLLKPPGMTSNDAVQAVKYALRPKARDLLIGHAGTLDPEAAGVLPLLLGRGTRLFDYLTGKQKEYIAEWIPGAATDTQDSSGKIISSSDKVPGMAELEGVLPRFTGQIVQTPPAYSALKKDGVPLYELARKGEAVEPQPRTVRIDRLEWIGETLRGRLLRVTCSRGVYVRTLCQDIGEAVGCAAHMGFLLRTRAGIFTVADSVTIEDALGAINADGRLLKRFRKLLTPLDAPVMDLPRIDANHPAAEKVLRCGNPAKRLMLTPFDAPDGMYRLYSGEMYAGVAELDAAQARLVYRMI